MCFSQAKPDGAFFLPDGEFGSALFCNIAGLSLTGWPKKVANHSLPKDVFGQTSQNGTKSDGDM